MVPYYNHYWPLRTLTSTTELKSETYSEFNARLENIIILVVGMGVLEILQF